LRVLSHGLNGVWIENDFGYFELKPDESHQTLRIENDFGYFELKPDESHQTLRISKPPWPCLAACHHRRGRMNKGPTLDE
jgi:hypothetical protein